MKKLVMCIPTLDRSEMLQEVLTYQMSYYEKYNIDIYYYDSSINDKSKQIINQYASAYKNQLLYKPIRHELCLDYKIVEILRDIQKTDYDYMWLINDSISITEEALSVIRPLLEKKYDLIRLPLPGAGNVKDYICTNVNQWFQQCSQGMAHMASTIMSTNLIHQADCNWKELRDRYIRCNELDKKHGYFFMVAFYLEQINKLPSFRGIMLGNRMKWRRDSPLKGTQIYWKDQIFQVWGKSYPDTIFQLPKSYIEKEKVIRISDNITPGRFSKPMLIQYRLKGIYNFKTFIEYYKYFPLITDLSIFHVFAISYAPKIFLKLCYSNRIVQETQWEERLEQIINRVMNKKNGKKIIIYGAGLYGEKVANKLVELGLQKKVIGIAVSNKQTNMKRIAGFMVYGIEELEDYKKDAYIIIATLPNAAGGIRKLLRKKHFKHYCALLGY